MRELDRLYREAAENTSIDEILDLIGGNSFEVETPQYDFDSGMKRYEDALLNTPDSTNSRDLMMPTDQVLHYREYDRSPDDADYQTLKKVIQQHGGIRQPLVLSTNDTHGLLTEGNHRAAIARELGITELPVRVFYDPEVQRNEGEPVEHDPSFLDWLNQNKSHLPGFFD